MARGRKSLMAARTLIGSHLHEDAISRAYYAVLHAAKAILALRGVFPRTHTGLRQMFALHLVKTGEIEREYGNILAYEQEDRETSDYDVGAEMKKADAVAAIHDAERFLSRMEGFLESKGIRAAGN